MNYHFKKFLESNYIHMQSKQKTLLHAIHTNGANVTVVQLTWGHHFVIHVDFL